MKRTFFGLFTVFICSLVFVGDEVAVVLNEFANCTIRFSISAILTLLKVSCAGSKADAFEVNGSITAVDTDGDEDDEATVVDDKLERFAVNVRFFFKRC